MTLSAKAKQHVRSHDELWDAVEQKRETLIFLLVGEVEAQALVAGTITESVREQARMAIDTEWTTAKAITRKAG